LSTSLSNFTSCNYGEIVIHVRSIRPDHFNQTKFIDPYLFDSDTSQIFIDFGNDQMTIVHTVQQLLMLLCQKYCGVHGQHKIQVENLAMR
jgi:hypothetical protein